MGEIKYGLIAAARGAFTSADFRSHSIEELSTAMRLFDMCGI